MNDNFIDAILSQLPKTNEWRIYDMSDLTVAMVTELPECDIHKYSRGQDGVIAKYDGKTNMGPWAYMCYECFFIYGIGLGTGKGQELKIRKAN